MKLLYNNLLHIFRRFRTASILNILGLSIAFATSIIILIQVRYDYEYDTFHKDAEKIYRIELVQDNDSKRMAVSSRGIFNYIITIPQIKEATFKLASSYESYFSLSNNNSESSFVEMSTKVNPNFPEFFDFKMISGTQQALFDPKGAIIPESMAKRVFGSSDVIGKTLYNKDRNFFVEEDYFIIKGVYKDFPRNSSIENITYASIGELFGDDWGNSMLNTFLRIENADDVNKVRSTYKEYIHENEFADHIRNADFHLSPFLNIHFDKDVMFDFMPKVNKETMMILFFIAFVIIIIAAVNYTNFSISLVPIRIKNINIRKVVGASDSSLIQMGIYESVFFCLFAYILGILLVFIVSLTPLITLVEADPSLLANIGVLGFTLAITLVVAFLSGLYPSFYMTSFQPALVLKGSFGLSPTGRKMRSVLISIQFIATFALIISAVFMYLQNQYIRNLDLGYNKDKIIVANLNMTIAEDREAITQRLMQYSEIEDVSYSWSLLSSVDDHMSWGRNYEGNMINFQALPVDPSFINVLGIDVDAGRNFRESDTKSATGKYIFNEKAQQEFGLQLNHSIDNVEIIGFIPNIQFATFHISTTPMAFYVAGTENFADFTRYLYVRVKDGSNMITAMDHIKSELTAMEPGWLFDVRFYDDILNKVYEKDRKLSLLITLFSIVTILISVIGVFGLVIFENEYRRREIGVRKVFGSTVREILVLLSKTYLIILVVCFIIACPIVYFLIDKWLQDFTIRTPLYAWVFLVSGLVVILITLITVNFQSWKFATANPVDSLKSE